MSETFDDDDDWLDLEPAAAALKPEATISLTLRKGRHPPKPGTQPLVRATLALRRDAADWARRNGPRFRAQVGGSACDRLRLVADASTGRYELRELLGGVILIAIGVVNVWPNEIRREVVAGWRETPGGLVIELPEGFARAGQGEIPPRTPEGAPRPAAPPAPFPITTRAEGLERRPTPATRRVVSLGGEPPPGRSALDARRKGAE